MKILGDLDVKDNQVLQFLESCPSDPVRDACIHFYSERQRAYSERDLLKKGMFHGFAWQMEKSHESSRDYAHTTKREGEGVGPLDIVAELGWGYEGCKGTSLFGGGFGGSIKYFLSPEKIEDFREYITREAGLRGLENVSVEV